MPDQRRILAGQHHLTELFQTVFEKRLAELGCGTTDRSGAGIPVLTIVLKQFILDLQHHHWKAEMAYEAELSLADHPTATNSIQGSAERVRVVGSKGADRVLGEIFSDVVNRLNLKQLFENAKLIPS